MSDIATRLRQCAADIRRTPVRLDTWIPLQQEAADTIDALRAEVDAFREDAANYYRIAKEADAQQAALRERVAELEGKVTAIVGWLEREQPDVFRRGLWDALREVPSADEMLRKAIRCAGNKSPQRSEDV